MRPSRRTSLRSRSGKDTITIRHVLSKRSRAYATQQVVSTSTHSGCSQSLARWQVTRRLEVAYHALTGCFILQMVWKPPRAKAFAHLGRPTPNAPRVSA